MTKIEILTIVLWLVGGLFMGTAGNVLYQVHNGKDITPFWHRVLYGLMGFTFYIAIYMYFTKEKPRPDMIATVLVFGAGYFTRMGIKLLEERIPLIFDSIFTKLLGEAYKPQNKKEKEVENEIDKK